MTGSTVEIAIGIAWFLWRAAWWTVYVVAIAAACTGIAMAPLWAATELFKHGMRRLRKRA